MKKFLSVFLAGAMMLASTQVSYAAAVTASRANNADDLANGAVFDNLGAWVLTVADNSTFVGNVTTAGNGGANAGTVTFAGTATAQGLGGAGNGLLAVNAGVASETVTVSGTTVATTVNLTGTGSLTLNGNMTGTLDYDNGATGTVTLGTGRTLTGAVTNTTTNEGTLVLSSGSSVTSAVGNTGVGLNTVTVSGGNATIGGNTLANNYTLNGNTLAVTGTLTVGSGATVATTLNSSTSRGNMTATGNATLSGNFTVAATVSGGITSGTAITIINTAGGTSGRTITVTDNSPRYTFTGENGTAGDVTITPTLVSSSSFTTSENNNNVAVVLDTLGGSSTGDMSTVQGALSSLSSTTELDAAYAQLDPNNNGVTSQVSFNTVNEAVGIINNHLSEVGAAGTGVNSGDFWTKNGIWAKGFGNTTDQDNHKGINGYDADMWGVIGGIDGEIAPYTRLGFAGGYASTDVDNKGDAGTSDIDSYIGSIYLGYDDESPWYGNFGFTFTWNGYDSDRRIVFTGVDRTASADYDGQAYTGFVDLGYVVEQQGWEITPIASLTYTHLEIDNYSETGALDLNLAVSAQDYDQLQSGLGIKLAYPIQNDSGKWVPEAHFKWLYDYIGDKASTTAAFTGGGSAFTTNGLDPEQSTFNVGGGVTFYSKGNVSVTGIYDFEGGDDFSSHTGQGIVRYTF